MILVKSQIYVTKFNLQNSTASIYSVINNTSVQTSSFSPISFFLDGFSGYICDSENGVFVLDLGHFFSAVDIALSVSLLLRVPLSLGAIYSCSYNNQFLNVGTSQGIVVYKCPEMTIADKLDSNLGANENLEGIARLESMRNRVEGYFITNFTTSFRLYTPTAAYSGSLELSEDADNLFGSDASLSSTPPYTWIASTQFIVFNTPNYIYVYQYNLPTLSTISINDNYTFSGDLKVSNKNDEILVPITICGIDPISMDIYDWRGSYRGNEYQQPYDINLYTSIRIDENIGALYLPISNYFSGQNLSYSLSLLQQTDNCNVTIINPPKFSLASSISVQSKPSFSPILIMSENSFISILVAIPTEGPDSYIFSLDNNGLPAFLHQISCSNSSMAANNAVTFLSYEQYLIVECIIQDSTSGAYDVDWDVYLFKTNSEYEYLASKKWFQIMYSSKIAQICVGNLAALRGSQVEFYSFNATDTSFIALPVLNSNSLEGLMQFIPIDIAASFSGQCFNIFVYDFNAGLISVNLTNFQTPYQATIYYIAGSLKDVYAKIAWIRGYLFVISPQSETASSFMLIKLRYSNSLEWFEYLPVFPGCIYTSLTGSNRFLSVLCENIKGNEMLIFDYHDLAFENLYAAVPIQKIGAASIYSSNSATFLYVYEGDVLNSYFLAQSADNFTVPASSNFVSTYSKAEVVWALLRFNSISPLTDEHTFDFELTAENKYNKNSTIISVNLISRGTVVQINENFNLLSSNLTAGNKIEVFGTQVTETVPLKSLKGNNVNFGLFDINKNGLIIDEQDCNLTPICIASKWNINGIFRENETTYDLCEFENMLYLSTTNAILTYNLSIYPYNLINSYKLSEIRGAYLTNCYKINPTPIRSVLIASCYEFPAQDSMYATVYLAVLNLTNLPWSTLTPQTYLAASIEVVNEQPYPLVYVYDYQSINIYELQPINNTYTLLWIFSINSEGIGVSMLQVNSILHLNRTNLILSDSDSGFLWLKASIEDNSYELYNQYVFPSLFETYISSCSSATLLSDQKTIVATEDNGRVLLISIDNDELAVKNQFPQLANEIAPWAYSIYLYEPMSLALYPICNSTFLWIRVLNYSESSDNSVFVDIPIGNDINLASISQFRILIVPETEISLRIILKTQYSTLVSASVILGEIRLSLTATFAPIEGYFSRALKLVGYIEQSGSEEMVGKFELQWGKNKENKKASSHLDWYSRWYVWVSIVAGIALLILVLVIAVKRRRKRRRLVSISLLSIDKQYRYSISDL